MPLKEFEQDNNVCSVMIRKQKQKKPEQNSETATPSTSKSSTSSAYITLSNFINDPDIKGDTKFLDKFLQIMTDSNTSKLFIPFRQSRQQILKNLVSKITSRYR